MTFLHPEFLYFMLPPLFILFGLLLTQKEAEASFFSNEVMERLRVSANTLTLKARNALFMLIGFLIIIALGDPVISEGKVEIKAKSADLMLALDISESMLCEDVYPNRLKLAKQKALEFLKHAKDERIGVVAFAKNSYLVSPLSFDHEAVAFLLSKLNTDSITEQGTSFLSLLEVVERTIKKESQKYLVIFSDGGDQKDFSQEIAYAKAHKIMVFVVGIGTQKGGPIPTKEGKFLEYRGDIVITKRNDAIAKLATQTGGAYIKGVNSNADVKALLHEIEAVAIKKERKSKEIQKYIPLFYYPVGLALLLLLIATSSMSKREAVHLPSAFVLGMLLFGSQSLHADILDFTRLKAAKEAYSEQNYKKSARDYASFAKEKENSEAYYNAANAYYKAKEYKKALKNYKKAIFSDVTKRANRYANLGNTYAKLGSDEDLKKAIEAYKESLALHKDKGVAENLKAVQKALKKRQRKKEQQKNQKQNKNQKNGKNSKQNKKNQQNQQNQQKSQQQKSQDKKSQNQQQQQKQESDAKSQQKQNKKQSSEEQKHQNKNSSEKKDAQKKEQLKELKEKSKAKKEQEKSQKNQEASAKQQISQKREMSNAEEKKWLKRLSSDQSTYLYRLNTKAKMQKDNSDEKPW